MIKIFSIIQLLIFFLKNDYLFYTFSILFWHYVQSDKLKSTKHSPPLFWYCKLWILRANSPSPEHTLSLTKNCVIAHNINIVLLLLTIPSLAFVSSFSVSFPPLLFHTLHFHSSCVVVVIFYCRCKSNSSSSFHKVIS